MSENQVKIIYKPLWILEKPDTQMYKKKRKC